MKQHLIRDLFPYFALFLGMCGCGCANSGPDVNTEESVVVTISLEPSSVSIGESTVVTVRVKNLTGENVNYGNGSSTCSLFGKVRLEGEEYELVCSRVCLRDYVAWELGPGEVKAEQWNWGGNYIVHLWEDNVHAGTEQRALPLGQYGLRGVAGPFSGLPTTVTISK